MKLPKKVLRSWTMLIIQFLLFLIMVIYAYQMDNHSVLLLVVLTNLGVFTCVYSIYSFRLRILNKKNIKIMTDAMSAAFKDLDENVYLISDDEDLADFYANLEQIVAGMRETERYRAEVLEIVSSVAVNMEFEKLLEDLMPKLIDVTKSNCCAFYMANHTSNKLEIKHSIGFNKKLFAEFDITLGEGYVGAASKSKKITIYKDIPEDTVYIIRTFLGKVKPRNLMIVPILNQETILGTLVFASIYDYTDAELKIVEMIRYYFGVAVGNGMAFERTKRLTNELKFQNTLIQNMNDELEKIVADRTIFLNNIIDNLQDYAIYAMNKNGVVTMWNKGAEMLTGYTSEEAMNKHVEMLYPIDQAETVRARIESVSKGGHYTESGRRARKDGSMFDYEMDLFCMYNENGDIIGISNATRDVSVLKSMENALFFEKAIMQRIIDDCTFALALTDERGTIIMANSFTSSLLDDEQLLGRGIYEFFEEWRQMYEQLKTDPQELRDGSWQYKLRDSEAHIVLDRKILRDEATEQVRILFYLNAE